MPNELRERIAADVRQALADPTIVQRLEAGGQEVVPGSAAEFAAPDIDQATHSAAPRTPECSVSRPRNRSEETRAPQQLHPYSITSSARASSVGGMSRPRVFAVLRLTISFVLVWRPRSAVAGLARQKDTINEGCPAPIQVDEVGAHRTLDGPAEMKRPV